VFAWNRRVKRNKRGLGALGEYYATQYLRRLGMTIVSSNWRCRIGELDLVVLDGNELVCVEVKSRSDSARADEYLFATLTPAKKRRLRLLAEVFAAKRFGSKRWPPLRIDVIGVVIGADSSFRRLKHLRGVV